MTTWYEYLCLECGHGGLTDEPDSYQSGQAICPRCGGVRFDVQERGLAPLHDEEDLEVED